MLNEKGELWRIAQMCRNSRLDARIRVKDMATLTGYSTGTIARFERGENNNLVLYLAYVHLCAAKGVYINGENTTCSADTESPDR